MINDKNLKQEGGEQSTNLQGQNVNIYNGISYSDAKEIFNDLFKSNFLQLKHDAADVAQQRAEEITGKFLDNLNTKSPESIKEFKEPAMQDALFTAQKEFAKSGDSDLGDLLVDILVDRAQTNKRNMLQLVLDESLKIAPSLTVEQLDTLSLNFLLIRTKSTGIRDSNDLAAMIKRDIEPFVNNLLSDNNTYNYLEFHRCGHVRTGGFGNLENNLKKTYKGLFSKGISMEEIEKTLGEKNNFPSLIMPCLHNKSLYQISTIDDEVLDQEMGKLNVPDAQKLKFKQIFNKSTMNATEVKNLLIKTNSCMKRVFKTWNNSRFKNFEVSSVGIAIAHANYRRRTGCTLDLSIWIN
ncbi:hypothetical protein RM549_12630 [Salegentibacter sp. F188]|uniref:Uncharacterized protein n=1 Tax=Autumnicola patrickiae TaxID=3075591 RepID=A0ABU3E3R1_9FLAO|nr:LPO_1073/Vpar_1526 family protein [Salegentibacter sp. F188]MDT0690637.1 hypothetical protein [Salegentibacter sp. F188]